MSYKEIYTVDKPSGRDFHQILIVVNGRGFMRHNDKTLPLEPGCAFFSKIGMPLYYESTDELTTAFLTVRGNAVYSLMKFYGCDGFLYRKLDDTKKYLSYIEAVSDEYSGNRNCAIMSAIAYSMYADFLDSNIQVQNQMKDILLYIEKNYQKKLTLSKIARKHGISVSKLSHNFKNEFGCTIFEHIINLRLSRARSMLMMNSNNKINDVALDCGFSDSNYFRKMYKQKYGVPPTHDKQ